MVVSYLFKCTFSYPPRIAAVFELLRIPVSRDIYRSLSNSWLLVINCFVLHGTLFDSGRATIDFEWSLFTCYKAHLPIVIEQQLNLSGYLFPITWQNFRSLNNQQLISVTRHIFQILNEQQLVSSDHLCPVTMHIFLFLSSSSRVEVIIVYLLQRLPHPYREYSGFEWPLE